MQQEIYLLPEEEILNDFVVTDGNAINAVKDGLYPYGIELEEAST